jgi:DNA-binding CsgD family transcriptional regulator
VQALTAPEVEKLRHAFVALASPTSFATPTQWRAAAASAVRELLRADSAMSMLPAADEAPVVDVNADPDGLAAYLQHYVQYDRGAEQAFKLGKRVAHFSELYDFTDPVNRSLHEAFCKRFGFMDTIAVMEHSADGRLVAAIPLYHERLGVRDFGERELTLLELLQPAFRAGVQLFLHGLADRNRIPGLLESVRDAVALFAADGRAVGESVAFTAALRESGAPSQLAREAQALARRAAGVIGGTEAVDAIASDTSPWERIAVTAAGRWCLRASLIPAGILLPQASVLVSLVPVGTRLLSAGEALARYRLTRREWDVARCIARGMRNAEIAVALDIRPSTARRHTEKVLAKLGVASRAAVAARLAPDAPGVPA